MLLITDKYFIPTTAISEIPSYQLTKELNTKQQQRRSGITPRVAAPALQGE